MPRRQSRTQSRAAPRPAARPAPAKNTPAPVQQQSQVPATAQPQQPGLFSQMASTAAGVAVGSTIGHTVGHAVTGMFGGGGSSQPAEQAPAQQQVQPQQYTEQYQPQSAACETDSRAFLSCLEKNDNDIGSCQFYFDMYQQCMRASKAGYA